VLIYDPLSLNGKPPKGRIPRNRELTPKEACIWLRWKNNFQPPDELRKFNSHVVGSMPARLEPDWQPAAPRSAGGRTGPKRAKKGIPALMIIAALEALAHKGQWDASETEIMKAAGVGKSTYYDVLRRDSRVQKAKDQFDSKRLGRGPVRSSDF
jgi:hypothetical protein